MWSKISSSSGAQEFRKVQYTLFRDVYVTVSQDQITYPVNETNNQVR